jgi:hypothetical protein
MSGVTETQRIGCEGQVVSVRGQVFASVGQKNGCEGQVVNVCGQVVASVGQKNGCEGQVVNVCGQVVARVTGQVCNDIMCGLRPAAALGFSWAADISPWRNPACCVVASVLTWVIWAFLLIHTYVPPDSKASSGASAACRISLFLIEI